MKRVFRNAAMLLLLCICGSAYAQMKVESFNVMENDLDARTNYPLADKTVSKKLCAIIKVVTTEMDCSYDIGSLEIAKIVKKPAEVWVYVPVGTKKIKISHPRQGQLNTDDGYYYLPVNCKSGTVYRLKLHTEFHPDEDDIKDKNKFAKVVFNVFPKNANIILRSSPEVTDANGHFEKSLPLGIFHYRISAENYHDYDGQFELKEEGSTQQIKIYLRQAFGWAELPANFETRDCKFFVADKQCPVNGMRITIPSGAQKLRIEKPNHYSTIIDVDIKDSMVTAITPDIKPILGKLIVSSPDQPGSEVKVDGKTVGTTPFSGDIIIGKHVVEISRPNYVSQTKEVTIAKGLSETVNVNLTSKGNFHMTSNPAGASLYLNGRYIGITPCSMDNIASGFYDIKLVKEGYHTTKKTVHLNAAVPDNSFKMKYQFQRKNQFYINPVFSYSNAKSFGVNVGAYFYNVNLEAFFDYGLDKQKLVWVGFKHGGWLGLEPQNTIREYKNFSFGARVGYGIILGTRFRITPQMGVRVLSVNDGEENDNVRGKSVALSLGCKFDVVLVKHLSLNVTPEYRIPLSKSDNYNTLIENSPTIEGWGKGFGCSMGLSVYF